VSEKSSSNSKRGRDGKTSLVDELGVDGLNDPVVGGRGRLFSTAGRESPIVEFTSDQVVMRPPQKPFEDSDQSELITEHIDNQGILLDELGNKKKIPGAKYNGRQIFWLGELMPGTLKHIVGWFDDSGNAHKLYINGELVTADTAFKLRNKTHDGEVAIFPDIQSDL
jgi:hypothetical protein